MFPVIKRQRLGLLKVRAAGNVRDTLGTDRSSTSADDILENIAADAGHTSLFTARLREVHAALDAVHQTREGQALQIDLARTGHFGQEQAFAAEQRVLEAAHELDVIIHGSG